jgi:hypothetical protein
MCTEVRRRLRFGAMRDDEDIPGTFREGRSAAGAQLQ